jgi:tetratricopeptide (TPR) repeat protein
LSKQRPQFALKYFLAAKQRSREGWSAERLASLNEFSGETLQLLRRASESEEYFREAKTLYAQAGKQIDSARAGRLLAIALFVSNKRDTASEELRSQPELDSDVESLRLLGHFAALSDQFSDAIEWYKLALKTSPDDRETRTALADSYESLGKKELAAKRFEQSRVWFEAAIKQRPDDGRRIYLATLPAYKLGDFADVATKLERVVDGTGTREKLAPAFVDAVWLTLFESYLLLGRYQDMDKRFDAATSALGPDARLLLSYFRFCGQAIGDTSKTADDLEKSPLFQSILNTAPPASGRNVSGWNNENVDAYLETANLPPDKRSLVKRANDRVLPAKLP